MSLAQLLFAFFVALIFVLVTIIRFKQHPFIALLIGGILMGLLSGMSLTDIANAMADGFGGTMSGIGIIIVLGVALGHMLHITGATEQIAALMIKKTGQEKAPLAITLTGLIVSIPVFFDAAFVILVELVRSISRKAKIPFGTLVTGLAVGLITAHAIIIPTPGPVVVADTMGVNLGWFLLYSIIVALPAVLIGGVVYGKRLGRSPDFADNFGEIEGKESAKEWDYKESTDKPSGALGIRLIFLPIVIILLGTIVTMFLEEGTFAYDFFNFIGNKNIALLIGVIVAYLRLKKYMKSGFSEAITQAATQAGVILAITGAGGAFGKIINSTGIGDELVNSLTGLTQGAGIGVIIAAFLISQILRAAQGSTTVALVTTSAMFAPLMTSLPGVSPILVGLAICAGGVGVSLPNDSGFWVVNRFTGFTTKQTLKVWTLGGTISGVTSLLVILVLSFFINALPGLL